MEELSSQLFPKNQSFLDEILARHRAKSSGSHFFPNLAFLVQFDSRLTYRFRAKSGKFENLQEILKESLTLEKVNKLVQQIYVLIRIKNGKMTILLEILIESST